MGKKGEKKRCIYIYICIYWILDAQWHRIPESQGPKESGAEGASTTTEVADDSGSPAKIQS